MKKVLSGVLVVLLMFSLTACGSSQIVGEWQLARATAAGQELSADEFAKASGVDLSKIGLSINSDGTFTISIPGDSNSGTWKKKGDHFELTADGETLNLTYDKESDELAVEIGNGKLVFERK